MTQAERRIRETLASEFPGLPLIAGLRATLEIPAVHDCVGPLYVHIDPEEITVFVGPTHCHFEHHDDEPEDEHIAQALEFIRGVLSDRIVLWSCLGAAGAYELDRESRFRLPWLVRRFLWSGPFPK